MKQVCTTQVYYILFKNKNVQNHIDIKLFKGTFKKKTKL